MFSKGNQLAKRNKGIKRSDDPTVLSHWLKRFKVDLNALTTIQRAELAIEAWKVSVKLPTKATDRATRTDDAQRLIKALEGDSHTPQAVQAQEGPVAAKPEALSGGEAIAIPTVGE